MSPAARHAAAVADCHFKMSLNRKSLEVLYKMQESSASVEQTLDWTYNLEAPPAAAAAIPTDEGTPDEVACRRI
jgi:hypothetical protein